MRVIQDALDKLKKLERGENAYLFEYLERVKDQTFNDLPFNVVDALIMTIISYMRFDFMELKENRELKLYEAAHIYDLDPDLYLTAIYNEPRNPFLKELAKSKRFKDLKLFKFARTFSTARECQFAAISIELSPQTVFISFSGTDSTLTGIKEDMNMAYLEKIPSQDETLKYMDDKVFKKYENIYLGGHSKGGYLAIYAAMNMLDKDREKVINIFNFDGPGFNEKAVKSFHAEELYKRTITIVPDMSIVGMIWNSLSTVIVVESNRYSMFQHDPFSWKIDENNHFVYKNYVAASSRSINGSVDIYMESLSWEERKKFIDLLWYFLKNTFTTTIKEFKRDGFKHGITGLKLYKELNEDSKNLIKKHIKILKGAMAEAQKSTKNFEKDIDLVLLEKLDKFIV